MRASAASSKEVLSADSVLCEKKNRFLVGTLQLQVQHLAREEEGAVGQHYCQLSAEERGSIQAYWQEGDSLAAIAVKLQRSRSTITREMDRNGMRPPGRPWGQPPIGYAAEPAGVRARRRRHRPRRVRKL